MNNTSKALTIWSRANWNKVPALVRQDCLNELHAEVPVGLMQRWVAQYKAGKEIGSDDNYFHFGIGMGVRNVLRRQLLDEELPLVVYKEQEPSRNWDDYYLGALQELVEQEIYKGNPR